MSEQSSSPSAGAQALPPYLVMVARILRTGEEPHPAALFQHMVRAESTTHAIRQGCEDSIRAALSLQGSSVIPVDVHVVYLHGDGLHAPATWEAEVRWRSNGRTLALAAGTVQRGRS